MSVKSAVYLLYLTFQINHSHSCRHPLWSHRHEPLAAPLVFDQERERQVQPANTVFSPPRLACYFRRTPSSSSRLHKAHVGFEPDAYLLPHSITEAHARISLLFIHLPGPLATIGNPHWQASNPSHHPTWHISQVRRSQRITHLVILRFSAPTTVTGHLLCLPGPRPPVVHRKSLRW